MVAKIVSSIKLVVREATLADINQVMALEATGFAKGIRERRKVFLGRIAAFPEGFLIATDEMRGHVIGYICSELWQFRNDVLSNDFTVNHEIGARHTSAGTELYVSSMTIRPDCRNYGLGARLFHECIEHARTRFPKITEYGH